MRTKAIIFLFGVFILASSCTVYTQTAPPPVRVEVQPTRPHAQAVWIGGHWKWSRWHHRHVWVPGHWVVKKHRRW